MTIRVIPAAGTGSARLQCRNGVALLTDGTADATRNLRARVWAVLRDGIEEAALVDALRLPSDGGLRAAVLVAPADDGFVVVVVGDYEVAMTTERRRLTVASAGHDPVAETVRDLRSIAVGPLAAGDDDVELADGVVAADGFTYRVEAPSAPQPPAPQPPARPEPAPSTPAPVGASEPLVFSLRDRSGSPGAPLPVPNAPAVPAPPRGAPAERPPVEPVPAEGLVLGVNCARGHFNDPRARYCAICGLAMHQASLVMIEGPRPPLGVLVFENGATYPLTTALVIGREPTVDPAVRANRALGLVPTGDVSKLSRVHARLELRDWDVVLSDGGSTNGTFVQRNGAWQRLSPSRPEPLEVGDLVRFARHVAAFESSLRSG